MNTARAAALGSLLLTAVGVAAASPAAAAVTTTSGAASRPSANLQPVAVAPALAGLTSSVPYVTGPAKDFRLDPLANSAADPLNNGVALQPDHPGAQPVSTQPLTSPLSSGGGLAGLPLVGGAAGLLPG